MSIYKKPPCKKDGNPCEKRHAGCHATCKEFTEWKESRVKAQIEINKQKELNRQLDDSNYQRIRKIKEGSKRR